MAYDSNICTLSDVKSRLGIASSEDEHDELLHRIILGFEAAFESYVQRRLILNSADQTEHFTGLGPWLRTSRYPVVSITSIKESYAYDFDSADALVADTDYRLKADKGLILRIGCDWPPVVDSVEIQYRGGFSPADSVLGEGEFAMPADLREALISQVTMVFKRRNDIGLSGISVEGGSFSKFTSYDLLPLVKDVLDSYRRLAI